MVWCWKIMLWVWLWVWCWWGWDYFWIKIWARVASRARRFRAFRRGASSSARRFVINILFLDWFLLVIGCRIIFLIFCCCFEWGCWGRCGVCLIFYFSLVGRARSGLKWVISMLLLCWLCWGWWVCCEVVWDWLVLGCMLLWLGWWWRLCVGWCWWCWFWMCDVMLMCVVVVMMCDRVCDRVCVWCGGWWWWWWWWCVCGDVREMWWCERGVVWCCDKMMWLVGCGFRGVEAAGGYRVGWVIMNCGDFLWFGMCWCIFVWLFVFCGIWWCWIWF